MKAHTKKAGPARRAKEHRYVLPPDNRRRPDAELLADLRRVARRQRTRVLTTAMYRVHGRFDQSTIISRFGGWSAAVRLVGLRPKWHHYSETELMLNLGVVWNAKRRTPVRDDLSRPPSRISCTPYLRRFGRFRGALDAFVAWADTAEGLRAFPSRQKFKAVDAKLERWCGRQPSQQRRSRQVPVSRRYQVLQRDRFRCRACGRSPANDSKVVLHVDHIRPLARGGSNTIENLQSLCKDCNAGKGANGKSLTARTRRRSR